MIQLLLDGTGSVFRPLLNALLLEYGGIVVPLGE